MAGGTANYQQKNRKPFDRRKTAHKQNHANTATSSFGQSCVLLRARARDGEHLPKSSNDASKKQGRPTNINIT